MLRRRFPGRPKRSSDPTLKYVPTRELAPDSEPKSLRSLASTQIGTPFVKWVHYFDIYSRTLKQYQDERRQRGISTPLRLLEIGVWRGGSLELWRKYLGLDAVIFGIDVDPESAQVPTSVAQVRIGSQTDPVFLQNIVKEMQGVDVVIDDGSHRSDDVLRTLRVLFPLLAEPGLYIIEDAHTSYWKEWGGGYRSRHASVEALKTLVDVLHEPYHEEDPDSRHLGIHHGNLRGLHFYDSIVVLEKDCVDNPVPFQGGSSGL